VGSSSAGSLSQSSIRSSEEEVVDKRHSKKERNGDRYSSEDINSYQPAERESQTVAVFVITQDDPRVRYDMLTVRLYATCSLSLCTVAIEVGVLCGTSNDRFRTRDVASS
jgi:hypothetical protein